MSSTLDKLNLRPHERRLVVVVTAIIFVVLNMWFVWPHFGDWQLAQDQAERNQRTLNRYRMEVGHVTEYDGKLKKLETEGSKVLPAEQSIDLLRTVQNLAKSNHVDITRSGQPIKSGNVNTNSFFEELSLPIDVTTGEKEMVDFLYELGSGNSMIRVRDLTLNPAGSGTNLVARMTLVASYQKQDIKTATQAKPAPGLKASETQAKSDTPKTVVPPPVTSPSVKTNSKPKLDAPQRLPRASTNSARKL